MGHATKRPAGRLIRWMLPWCLLTACATAAPTPSSPQRPPATTTPAAPAPLGDAHATGLRALEAGAWTQAVTAFEAAHAEAPGRVEPLVNLSIAQALAGDHAGALASSEAALRDHPGVLLAATTHVEALLAMGQREAALTIADRQVEAHPHEVAAWYALGRAHGAFVHREATLDAFERAHALDPQDLPTRIALFGFWAREPDSPERDDLAEQLGRDAPDHPLVIANMGAMAEVDGELKRARDLYLAALDKAPDLYLVRYNLANLIDHMSGPAAARPHFEAFIRVAPPGAARLIKAVEAHLDKTSESDK